MRRPPVKSAARVLEVFEYFAEVRHPLALKEIVEKLAYPQSSTTNLLKSLVELGYLHYDRTRRTYYPTFRIAALGEALPGAIDDDILDLMRRMQERSTETILLAMQNDVYLQYVRVMDSKHELRFYIKEGSMKPLTQSSLGWILLSQKSPAVVEKLCRQINAYERSANRKIAVPSFLKEIEKVKKQRYCYVPNLPELGGGSVSMLVPGTIRGQQMAIGIGGLCVRIDKKLDTIVSEARRMLADYEARIKSKAAS